MQNKLMFSSGVMGTWETLAALLAILGVLIFGVLYFADKERKESFKRFYQKLKRAGASEKEAKGLFFYMWTRFDKQYHLFFQEPVIAEKAVAETGANKEILANLNIKTNRDTVDIIRDKFVSKNERAKQEERGS